MLISRVSAVAGRSVGNPLTVREDSESLRKQFDLTIECTDEHWSKSTVFAFNDDGACAAVKMHESFTAPHWVRRATCIAVASMWTPAIEAAYRNEISKGAA